MKLPTPQVIGFTYLTSELLLNLTRRSADNGVRQDRSTLRVLWLVIMASVAAGVYVALHWRNLSFANPQLFALVGLVLFVAGMALRWWAIIILGRFFTVDVQIAADHQLVERGPFRFVRHPSYTGALLAFAGFGFSLGNWAATLAMFVPIFFAFLRRMNVEEQALVGSLGETYVSYMQRTKRLLPFLY